MPLSGDRSDAPVSFISRYSTISRRTAAPGSSSSLHRPVILTWTVSTVPFTSTWAIKRLGRSRKMPSTISLYFNVYSILSDTPAPEPLAARQNRLLQAFNHWQEPVYFLQLRHPQTMQVAVGVDRHRLFGAQLKHRLGCLTGSEGAELSHKNPFQKISPSLSSAFTSSTLRHEQRKMSPCHRHGKGESPQGTTKQPLHEPASLLA